MGDSYPGGQGTLSYQQIQDLWTSNGGNPAWAPLMASIAEAESSGHYGVLNDTPGTGDYSVGLWQINYYGNLLTPRSNRYGSPAQLWSDPNAQAKAAIDLFANGQGAGNWQGDAAYEAWKRNGGPMTPSAAQLASFGAPTGGSATGTLPSGGGGNPLTTPPGSPYSGISVPILGTIVSGSQEMVIKGWFFIIAGGAVATIGMAVLFAAFGLESKVGRVVAGATVLGKASKGAEDAGAAAVAATPEPPSAPTPPSASNAFAAGRDQGAQEGYAEAQYEAQTPADRAANRRAAADFRGRPHRSPTRTRNLPPERTRAG